MQQRKYIDKIIKKFDLDPKHRDLITQSFYHSSFSNEQKKFTQSNERLEFLGDTVLNLVISHYLYNKYPNIQEGLLSKKRAQLICEEALVVYSYEISLCKCLFLGKGEEKNGGRERNLILADAFEAFIGSIFLLYGFEKVEQVLLSIIIPVYEHNKINMHLITDYKTILQEIINADFKKKISYRVIEEKGLPHKRIFKVATLLDDMIYGIGEGTSKKEAEQKSALAAVNKLAKYKTI